MALIAAPDWPCSIAKARAASYSMQSDFLLTINVSASCSSSEADALAVPRLQGVQVVVICVWMLPGRRKWYELTARPASSASS